MAPTAPPAAPPPENVPSASSKPTTIKLKVGAAPTKPPAKPPIKPKGRKPKVVDAPPPPYVDDGSHDILQEVIAIEREKDEQRHRWRSSTERTTENGISKRKKANLSDDDDDDLLAHATPSKKERPSPINSSTEAIPRPTSTPKFAGILDAEDEPSVARPSPETPRASIKGKEKEVDVTPSKPKKVPAARSTPTPFHEKKCKEILKTLLKLPEALIFSRPVDPVIDGCPT
jgi:transcription initiation factor TFIID subunit 2